MATPRALLCCCCCLWLLVFRTAAAISDDHMQIFVDTETSLIDTLRDYIDNLESQIEAIRQETAAVQNIHDKVGDHVEQHMGNPLNVVTILKRFESVWPKLEKQANDTHNPDSKELVDEKELYLPTDAEYEASLTNLLRLQSIYELEPASLAVGIVNGQKLGSSMSWSDCLEIARKSDKSEDYAVTKYWLETALGKLSNATEESLTPTVHISSSERELAHLEVLELMLSVEYSAGYSERALTTAEELLLLRPKNEKVLKVKTKIEQALSQHKLEGEQKKDKKLKKSAEQLLTEELCREATQHSISGSRMSHCSLIHTKPEQFLKPQRLELLSLEPYIALQHDVLSLKQLDELQSLIDEDDDNSVKAKRLSFTPLKLTRLGQKKLRRLSQQLLSETHGNTAVSVDHISWQAQHHGHEHVTATHATHSTPESEHAKASVPVARAMLNLQQAKLGGAVVFPQLELSVNVPRGSLLYWRTLNEFHALDYRSQQIICPVLLGAQQSAWTALS